MEISFDFRKRNLKDKVVLESERSFDGNGIEVFILLLAL